MTRFWLVGWLGLLTLTGCKDTPTTVLLRVEAEQGVGQLDAVLLSVFTDDGAAVLGRRLPEGGGAPDLPDDVVLYPKRDSGTLRILGRGLEGAGVAGEGTALVELNPGEQVRARLTLSADKLPDTDGDGVPDVIDNCVDLPNPQQGPCGGADGGVPGDAAVDMMLPDLAPVACTSDEDCDDKTVCTDDSCSAAGFCVHQPITCPDPTEQCKEAICDAQQGCQVQNRPDGSSCNDGKYCTVGDSCVAGACTGKPRDCKAGAAPCTSGACDDTLNKCVYSPATAGSPCDDNDPCTQGEVCAGSPLACTAPGPQLEVIAPMETAYRTDRSTAVDSQGGVHTLFMHAGAHDLRYAYKPAGGSWQLSTLDSVSGEYAGLYPAVAIDSADQLHVVYARRPSLTSAGTLRYATRPASGGAWVKDTIGPGEGHSSVVVEASGKVHVSYMSSHDLWYAVGGGGSWSTVKVDDAGLLQYAGIYSSIALDGTMPVIAHGHGTPGSPTYNVDKLRFDEETSNGWGGLFAAGTVTSSHGSTPSIVVTKSGIVHIVHCGDQGLLLTSRSPGGTWSTTTIDPGQTVFASAVLDSKDNLHVSYREWGKNQLRHATNVSGSWQTQVLDTGTHVGRWSSIARAPSGRIHVTYEHEGSSNMKHAFFSACP